MIGRLHLMERSQVQAKSIYLAKLTKLQSLWPDVDWHLPLTVPNCNHGIQEKSAIEGLPSSIQTYKTNLRKQFIFVMLTWFRALYEYLIAPLSPTIEKQTNSWWSSKHLSSIHELLCYLHGSPSSKQPCLFTDTLIKKKMYNQLHKSLKVDR